MGDVQTEDRHITHENNNNKKSASLKKHRFKVMTFLTNTKTQTKQDNFPLKQLSPRIVVNLHECSPIVVGISFIKSVSGRTHFLSVG